MLERRSVGEIADAPHTQLKSKSGQLRYEHCITRQGFDGPYTISYHQHRPQALHRAGDIADC